MKLLVGKRYIRRDGKITGVLETVNNPYYSFRDTHHGHTYTELGDYDISGDEDPKDLVEEYGTVEPDKLTLLDTFAIAALQGMLANTACNDNTCDYVYLSQQVFEIARAMLEERKKHQ